ncbi:MAG: hypothetical protein V1886_00530 [archaeon]
MKRITRLKKKSPEKGLIRKFWWFIWESPSAWSWIIDLILLYILVKFVFFPVAGLMAGTSLPSVIVESGSMHHSGNFEEWWNNFGSWYEEHNISINDAMNWQFTNGIDKGDIILVSGRIEGNLKVGDVIIFDAGQSKPIIHRVISISGNIGTKGDNNAEQLSAEKEIEKEKIVGRAIFRIPKIGWAKLIFVELANSLSKAYR